MGSLDQTGEQVAVDFTNDNSDYDDDFEKSDEQIQKQILAAENDWKKQHLKFENQNKKRRRQSRLPGIEVINSLKNLQNVIIDEHGLKKDLYGQGSHHHHHGCDCKNEADACVISKGRKKY